MGLLQSLRLWKLTVLKTDELTENKTECGFLHSLNFKSDGILSGASVEKEKTGPEFHTKGNSENILPLLNSKELWLYRKYLC